MSNINISTNGKQEWSREVLCFTPRQPITVGKIAAIFVSLRTEKNIGCLKILQLKYLLGVKNFIVCQGGRHNADRDIRSREDVSQSETLPEATDQ